MAYFQRERGHGLCEPGEIGHDAADPPGQRLGVPMMLLQPGDLLQHGRHGGR